MDFELNEEHRLIQATVREFAAKEILPVAAELDHNPRYPAEIIASAAALGLLGLTVQEEYGGAGLDGLANVLVQEALARAPTPCRCRRGRNGATASGSSRGRRSS